MTSQYLETDADLRRRVEARMKTRKDFGVHALIYGVVVGVMWLRSSDGHDLWLQMMTLGWGAGLAAHGMSTYYKSGKPAMTREQRIWREMRALYGDHWREAASRDEYERVRYRISKPFDKRRDFSIHISIYILVNSLLWLFGFREGSFSLPLIVSGVWGIALVWQFIDSFLNFNQNEGAIELALMRERERMTGEGERKPKRKRMMTLSDDGELVELLDDMSDEPLKRKRD